MLRIARQTDYAARVVLYLASRPEGDRRVTAAEIARLRLIPPAFVRRVVSRLSAAGILATTRGNRGGVELARPPARINLLDVVKAMEGTPALNLCVEARDRCPLGGSCALHDAWHAASRALEDALSGRRFDGFAKRMDRRRRPGRGRRGGG